MSSDSNYTPASGPRLLEFLDGLPVTTRWLSGHHVVWQTGQQNVLQGGGPAAETHCSAFVAAVALMLDIYLLRPPNHGQEFLADAQADWLNGTGDAPGPTAKGTGWIVLGTADIVAAKAAAAERAGRGQLVLAIYHAPPDPGTGQPVSGHVCIVLTQQPPQDDQSTLNVMSVGEHNWPKVEIETAFRDHPLAWPSRVHFYAHGTVLEQDFAA